MTAYEAIKLLQRVVTDTYTMDDNPRKQCEAVNTLLDYIKQPDPDTGLMPCGCGGEAISEQYGNWMPSEHNENGVRCHLCGINTGGYETEEEAKRAWNRAMGASE